jgi:hypothetical protein
MSLVLRRALLVAILTAGLLTGITAALPSGAPTAEAAENGLGQKPYRGWTSWSLQTTSYPGVNPRGQFSWLNEANVLRQVDAMATKLKPYGYDYINIDAGWWFTYDWKQGFDANGRQTPNAERFPRGMKYVADYIHGKGLKAGIYLPVGLEKGAYDGGDFPIAGAPECSTHDIVYADRRTTNGWDSAYKIDFSKPCAQKYVDSQANMIADWGYDFLKFDGVGPGSGKSGPNYDNRADVAAWSSALIRTGRPILLEVSWSLEIDHVADWKRYANGWRIDTDVECYCGTLVTWNNSVKQRWADLPAWVQHAGPGGWNDLDAINVGNGAMDGINNTERQSVATLWAISATPWYSGDDLTQLDSYGLSLLTNTEVLAVNEAGRPAKPVRTGVDQQVWWARNADGSYTVALFNLGSGTANVTANWSDFGFTGGGAVRDLWSRTDLGTYQGGFSASVPSHGSRLLRVTPTGADPNTSAWKNEASSRCLDVINDGTANGTKLNLWDCHQNANQRWTTTAAGELRVYNGSKCLDVPGTAGNGTRVVIWDCNGGANQKWDAGGDGTIRARQSGFCLDAFGTGNGAAVGLWQCHGAANQRWSRV